MDGNRFDELTRLLAKSGSRRTFIGSVVGGALALVGSGRASAKSDRVTVCHQPGTPAQQTLTVDNSAVPGHLGHGDYTNASGCCAAGVPVCVDAAGNGTCCPAPSRCLGNGVCCTPTTCVAQGVTCGTISDNCGGTLECGTCGDDQTCHQGSCCTPTCQGDSCGEGLPDGCGGTINCECPAEQVCHEGSCCSPTCPGNACGIDLPNGCGGTINCECLAGAVCHEGECCTPICQGNACGEGVPDGCGGETNCECLGGQVCNDGECCTQVTSCPAGQTCGTAPDGCGGTLECGSCDAGACQVCSDDGTTCVSSCDAPLTCLAGACKLPDGATGCIDDGQCHSGICAAGTCQAAPGADGTACDSNADCVGGHCVNIVAGSGVCCTTGKACGTVCCASNTQVCDPAGDCCSPATCATFGATCGFVFDNCGFELNCGTCGSSEECIDNTCQSICKFVAAECSTGDVCCNDLICGFDADSSTSRSCCRPRGSDCGVAAGGGSGGCCDGSTCVEISPIIGSQCVGCHGTLQKVFGGPACDADIQCCSGFCHEESGNCCAPLGSPCSGGGSLSLDCCVTAGHACSPTLGCIVCRELGESCEPFFGVDTCCLGSNCDPDTQTCVQVIG